MKEFYLPIEECEENLDFACNIAASEALGEDGPVFTLFQGVPMVALPVDGPDMVRDNWQRMFDQFQAQPLVVNDSVTEEPTPAKKAWRQRKWFGAVAAVVAGFIVALALRGFGAFVDDWCDTDITTYHASDNSITVNYDAWKKQVGCKADEMIQTSGYAVGSDHGNRTVKLTPYCVSIASMFHLQQQSAPEDDGSNITLPASPVVSAN